MALFLLKPDPASASEVMVIHPCVSTNQSCIGLVEEREGGRYTETEIERENVSTFIQI